MKICSNNPDKIRVRHMKRFSILTADEQMKRALYSAYSLREMMSKEDRIWADKLRNGGKKNASRIRRAIAAS